LLGAVSLPHSAILGHTRRGLRWFTVNLDRDSF
jgi:hypothetical protein